MELLMPPMDSTDVLIRMSTLTTELTTLDDPSLMEEIMEIVSVCDVGIEAQDVVVKYDGGRLTPSERKMCEGIYCLWYSDYALEE